MKQTPVGIRVEMVVGDLTVQEIDAIVNAANSGLAGGGGVDGAIHWAAGPTVMQETRERYPEGCRTGCAVITSAGNLRAKYIFHAVGPIWNGGLDREAQLLDSAVRNCLHLADDNDCAQVGFPAISTGAYGYPMNKAAHVMLSAVYDFRPIRPTLELVRFVLFDGNALKNFEDAWKQLVQRRTVGGTSR